MTIRYLENGSERIRMTEADVERFWSEVLVTETCWLWVGGLTDKGYGRIKIDGKMRRTHIVGYLLQGGKLRDDDTLDHKCLTRACLRRKHLEPMTDTENTLLQHLRAGRHIG